MNCLHAEKQQQTAKQQLTCRIRHSEEELHWLEIICVRSRLALLLAIRTAVRFITGRTIQMRCGRLILKVQHSAANLSILGANCPRRQLMARRLLAVWRGRLVRIHVHNTVGQPKKQ